jgi:hypothetical protein
MKKIKYIKFIDVNSIFCLMLAKFLQPSLLAEKSVGHSGSKKKNMEAFLFFI